MAQEVFVVNPAGWKLAFESPVGTLGSWTRKKTTEVFAETVREVPRPGGIPHNMTGINYATGVLAAGHVSRVTMDGGTPEGRIIALPKHAVFVVKGTRPHIIRPKNPSGRLRFFWHRVGRVVYPRVVHHPGTAANNYMLRGLERAFRGFL